MDPTGEHFLSSASSPSFSSPSLASPSSALPLTSTSAASRETSQSVDLPIHEIPCLGEDPITYVVPSIKHILRLAEQIYCEQTRLDKAGNKTVLLLFLDKSTDLSREDPLIVQITSSHFQKAQFKEVSRSCFDMTSLKTVFQSFNTVFPDDVYGQCISNSLALGNFAKRLPQNLLFEGVDALMMTGVGDWRIDTWRFPDLMTFWTTGFVVEPTFFVPGIVPKFLASAKILSSKNAGKLVINCPYVTGLPVNLYPYLIGPNPRIMLKQGQFERNRGKGFLNAPMFDYRDGSKMGLAEFSCQKSVLKDNALSFFGRDQKACDHNETQPFTQKLMFNKSAEERAQKSVEERSEENMIRLNKAGAFTCGGIVLPHEISQEILSYLPSLERFFLMILVPPVAPQILGMNFKMPFVVNNTFTKCHHPTEVAVIEEFSGKYEFFSSNPKDFVEYYSVSTQSPHQKVLFAQETLEFEDHETTLKAHFFSPTLTICHGKFFLNWKFENGLTLRSGPFLRKQKSGGTYFVEHNGLLMNLLRVAVLERLVETFEARQQCFKNVPIQIQAKITAVVDKVVKGAMTEGVRIAARQSLEKSLCS